MAVAHKGSISMGMVSIPIGLYKTTVDNDIHFNQLEKESKARIKYKKYCSHCGKEVRIAVSGYIQEKGTQLFQLTVEKELEGVVAKKASSLYSGIYAEYLRCS